MARQRIFLRKTPNNNHNAVVGSDARNKPMKTINAAGMQIFLLPAFLWLASPQAFAVDLTSQIDLQWRYFTEDKSHGSQHQSYSSISVLPEWYWESEGEGNRKRVRTGAAKRAQDR